MAMSGIEIDQEIKTLFDDMKLRKTHKWATFKISDNKKSIEVDQKGDPMPTESREDDVICFNELMATLGKEPRYILYDFSFKIRDGRLIQKLAFIFWCDDNNATIKLKMLYASSKDTIKKAFTGLGLEFQANDRGDMDYTRIADEVEKKA